MSRPRKYRLWTDEEKRTICHQARGPGVSVAQVARRYAMNANLIFKWLKDPRYAPGDRACKAPVFLPVEIIADAVIDAAPVDEGPATACGAPCGRMEIILPDGVHVKVDGGFDGVELARLVRGLVA